MESCYASRARLMSLEASREEEQWLTPPSSPPTASSTSFHHLQRIYEPLIVHADLQRS